MAVALAVATVNEPGASVPWLAVARYAAPVTPVAVNAPPVPVAGAAPDQMEEMGPICGMPVDQEMMTPGADVDVASGVACTPYSVYAEPVGAAEDQIGPFAAALVM